MGQRKFPPLTPKEIEDILLSRGFVYYNSKGDHNYYYCDVNGEKRVAQIDMGADLYVKDNLKLVIKESGMNRIQFYTSTKRSAKKINKRCAPKNELLTWAVKEND